MAVRIDAAGHDQQAGRVDRTLTAKVQADGGDAFAGDAHIGLEHVRRGDDGAAGDHQIIVSHD